LVVTGLVVLALLGTVVGLVVFLLLLFVALDVVFCRGCGVNGVTVVVVLLVVSFLLSVIFPVLFRGTP